ncbi:MAG TPA: glutathione S-transferase family protein [Gaiellaceae bacterium]
MKLYDAARCPFCARVRIALAEKGLDHERVEIDLRNRPDWIYDLNPTGKVPVVDDGFVLPESAVIMEYLDDRYPEQPLLPDDPKSRAVARKWVFRFDDLLGDDYYAYRSGGENALAERLENLPVGDSLFVDVAYAPWVIRAKEMLGVTLPARLDAWLERLAARPSVAAEIEVVRSLG